MSHQTTPDQVDWVAYEMADSAHIRREKAKARELRATNWWRQRIGTGVCAYCGGKFLPSELTMDHRHPIARGGRSTKTNAVVACRPCNQSKGHKTSGEKALLSMGVELDGR